MSTDLKKKSIKSQLLDFQMACETGNLQECKRILTENPQLKISIKQRFIEVCCNGHFDVAKWMFETMKVNQSAINEAKYCNNLDLLKWLYSISRGKINYANIQSEFEFACQHNNVDVAKWLVQIEPTIDISRCKNDTIRNMLIHP